MPRKKATEQENTTVQNEAVEEKKTAPDNAEIESAENQDISPASEVVQNDAETGEVPKPDKEDVKDSSQDVNVNEEPASEETTAAESIPDHEEQEPVKETKKLDLGVLKIRLDEEEQEDDEFETLWNELVTYYRSRRILPVTVTGIERTQLAGNVVVTYYKDQRILVPMTEMMINLSEERGEGYTLSERLERVCNTMLGAEIDVMIKGMDKKNGSIVLSHSFKRRFAAGKRRKNCRRTNNRCDTACCKGRIVRR